jgi:glycoside/pentoside/hexuronide:cation symporter, GPH family
MLARYGAAVAPAAILGLPFSIYLPPYLVESGSAPVAMIGLFFFVSAIWDGAVDPIIGTVIDRKRSAGVHHWQWMLRSAIPLVLLVSVIIFIPTMLPGFALLIALLLLYSVYSIYDVAHAAWGAGLAKTATETAQVFGAREFWSKISLILAFGLPAAMQALDPGISLFNRIAAYTGLAIATIPIALLISRGLPMAGSTGVALTIEWRREIKATLHAPVLLLVLGTQLLGAIAIGALASLFIFFADSVLGLAKAGSILLFCTFLGGAIGVPVWTRLGAQHGKATVLIWLFAWISVSLMAAVFLPKSSLVPALVFALVLGSGFVLPVFLLGLMADVAPFDAAASGRDRTAFLLSLVSVAQKIGNALAIGVGYSLLDLFGFDANLPQQSSTLVLALFVGLPVASLALAAILANALRRRMRILPAIDSSLSTPRRHVEFNGV